MSGCIPLLARPILLFTGQYIVQNYHINNYRYCGVTNLNGTYILGDKSLDMEAGTWDMEAGT